MSEVYYPNTKLFWSAIRARNFVKALGMKPGDYSKNMETLSNIAGVQPYQMGLVNPATFAERNGLSAIKLVGYQEEIRLQSMRKIIPGHWYHRSATWEYEQSLPEITQMEYIKQLLIGMESLPSGERLPHIHTLLCYMMTVEPLLRKYPQIFDSLSNKVQEFKNTPDLAPLMDTLLKTEAFLVNIELPDLVPIAWQLENERWQYNVERQLEAEY